MPRISVIMPVHNGEEFISESIESILNQTFEDFELVVVNDNSTDSSVDIARSVGDSRIKVIDNPNSGLVSALNFAIGSTKSEFLARQDADDISEVDRLQRQIDVFDSDLSIGLVGTNAKTFGSANTFLTYPKLTKEIKARLLFENPFAHSSVMFRRSAIPNSQQPYEESFPVAEDFRLWSQISRGWEMHNIQQPLLRYRVHSGQVSIQKAQTRILSVGQILESNLKAAGMVFTTSELELHTEIATNPFALGLNFGKHAAVIKWFSKLQHSSQVRESIGRQSLDKEIQHQQRRLLKYTILSPAWHVKRLMSNLWGRFKGLKSP